MKVLVDFRRNLSVGHLIGGLHGDDVSAELIFIEALFQFAPGLPRTKDQDGFGMTNGRNHLIVVLVQMARKLPLATIIGLNLLWFVRSR